MPTRQQSEEAKQLLLHAINLLCPDQYDQRAAVNMVHEAEQANEPDVNRRLAGFLYDGLAYGNWPSALARRAKE